tara:strand:+ start:800 stop:1078 length:279 start_codon:yes stop_codon:yes gene_type:complete
MMPMLFSGDVALMKNCSCLCISQRKEPEEQEEEEEQEEQEEQGRARRARRAKGTTRTTRTNVSAIRGHKSDITSSLTNIYEPGFELLWKPVS